MKTFILGKSGLEVSRVGFGSIPIQRLSEAEAIRVVRRSLDLGVTFLDTANGYTTSEERIGKAIAGRREQVVVATKTMARDKDTAQEHLNLSLQRLDTHYVDLWQFHNISSPEAIEQVLGPDGAMDAAREAIQAGKVRHVGVSSHSLDMAFKMVASGLFETIQFPFSFIATAPAEALVPLARTHNVGFIAMKPFGGGLFGNAPLALKYLLQFDNVLPDPGIEKIEEIEEIVAIADGPCTLRAEEEREMAQIRAQMDAGFCRRCDYCQPCPQGVRISEILGLRSLWRRFPPEVFRRDWVVLAADSGRNCQQCGECEQRCPYELPIREMLVENLDFYEHVVS